LFSISSRTNSGFSGNNSIYFLNESVAALAIATLIFPIVDQMGPLTFLFLSLYIQKYEKKAVLNLILHYPEIIHLKT